MAVTDVLMSAFTWTYRQMQYYQFKAQLQEANQMMQQAVYETGRQRQAEEIKRLKLVRELQGLRECIGRDLHDGFGSQMTDIISRLDLMACTGTSDPDQLQRLSQFARDMNRKLGETFGSWTRNLLPLIHLAAAFTVCY